MATQKSISKSVYTNMTPEKAEAYINTYEYGRQHSIRPNRVTYLAFQHALDKLLGQIITIVLATPPDGKTVMINGYHCLQAIIKTNKPLWLNVQQISCTSSTQVNELYTQHDRTLNRNLRDGLKAYGIENLTLNSREMALLCGAVKVLLTGFSATVGKTKSPYLLALEDREAQRLAIEDWLPLAAIYFDLVHQLKTRPLRRPFTNVGTLASAMICYKHRPEKAQLFWPSVINPDLEAGTASQIATLHKKLVLELCPTRKVTPEGDHEDGASPQLYAHVISAAWNAFIARRRLSAIKTPGPPTLSRPLFFAETVYNGIDTIFPTIPNFDMKDAVQKAKDAIALTLGE